MGERPIESVAKGAICYCLDQFSKGRGARARVVRLRDELLKLDPPFSGLMEVFDRYLLSHVISDAAKRQRIVRHLERHWFDQDSPEAYFPRVPVASIYVPGVLKALDLALLAGRRAVPLNSWWLLDFPVVKLLSLVDLDSRDETIGGRVTLLILTPRPKPHGKTTDRPIMGEIAEAFVTEYGDKAVETVRTRKRNR